MNENKILTSEVFDWESALRRTGYSEEIINRQLPLFNESARGAVLLSVAKLDESLSSLHKTYIRHIVTDSKPLLESLFQPFGPLSSLAGKTQIAYAYGLITAEDYADLNRVRKLRNLAAHSDKEFTFAPSESRQKLKELTILKRAAVQQADIPTLLTLLDSGSSETAKLYFLLSVLSLKSQIVKKELSIKSEAKIGNTTEAEK